MCVQTAQSNVSVFTSTLHPHAQQLFSDAPLSAGVKVFVYDGMISTISFFQPVHTRIVSPGDFITLYQSLIINSFHYISTNKLAKQARTKCS